MTSESKSEGQAHSYSIRQCTTLDDYAACLELQRIVWQFDELDITPLRSFVITRRSGGFTLGAYDSEDKLVGFAHALAVKFRWRIVT